MEENKEMMAEEVKEPYKVYETKEAWQESIDAIIGARLKDYRETKESMEALAPIVEEIKTLTGAQELADIPQKMREKAEEKEQPVDMETLRNAFPEENLDGMEENEYFSVALRAGLSPEEAVRLALGAVAKEVPKNKKPVEESAMNPTPGMRVKITPSKMTFKELDEISARVARGEKISF